MSEDGSECLPCHEIHEHCTQCELDENNEPVCTECRGGLMVSYDKLSCIHKFTGCRIDVDEQPENLPYMSFKDEDDIIFEEYYCPECLTGYFWDIEAQPWTC